MYGFSETWLTESISSSEYFNANYNVFRKDRLDRGGGVLIAVNSRYSSEIVSLDNTDNIEFICVKILIKNNINVYFAMSYIPPCSSSNIYKLHNQAINLINAHCNESDIVITAGDFNIPHADWMEDDENPNIMYPVQINPEYAADFIYSINELGLYQVNNVWRKAEIGDHDAVNEHKLLDLVFTNDPDNLIVSEASPLVKLERCHPPVLLTFEWNTSQSPTNEQTPSFNFNRADYDGM